MAIPLLNPTAAQQLLLDIAAFKNGLIEIVKRSQKDTATLESAMKEVLQGEVGRIEGVLKTVLAPMESMGDVFERKVLGGDMEMLKRICEMRGMNAGETSKIVLGVKGGGTVEEKEVKVGVSSGGDDGRSGGRGSGAAGRVMSPEVRRAPSQITAQLERTGSEAVEAVTDGMKKLWGRWGESLTGGMENAAQSVRRGAAARGFRFGNR